jgi:hydroxyacylglutathione hydrolase
MSASVPPLQIAIIPVTPFQQNCAILRCTTTNQGAILDPGGDADEILRAVEQVGVKIEKILLTHGHLDHAGGVADIVAALKVPVEGPHRLEKPLLERIEHQARLYGIAGLKNAWSDRFLEEGDTVSLGALTFDIRFIPGHSPGSVVYISQNAPLAFVGDTLFQGSVGRTDLPGGDHAQLIAGIREKLLVLPDETVCFSGHGPATTIGTERKTNPYLR